MPEQSNSELRWGGFQTLNLPGATPDVTLEFRAVTINEPYSRLWLVRRFISLSRPLIVGENLNFVWIFNEGLGTASARYEVTDAMVAPQQVIGPSNFFAGPAPWVGASQLQVDLQLRNSGVLSSITITAQAWAAPLMPVTPLPVPNTGHGVSYG